MSVESVAVDMAKTSQSQEHYGQADPVESGMDLSSKTSQNPDKCVIC